MPVRKQYTEIVSCAKQFSLVIITGLLCILCSAKTAFPEKNNIQYIGKIPQKALQPGQDTIRHFDLFYKYHWDIEFFNEEGNKKTYATNRWDTISEPVDFKAVKAVYSATFHVRPSLLHTIYSLRYQANGSMLLTLNGERLVATGKFADNNDRESTKTEQDNFANIVFNDTLLTLRAEYYPAPDDYEFELTLGQRKWSEEILKYRKESAEDSFALGFYYLAFGIVFLLLFLFYNVISENLYFASFCIMASLAFLADVIPLSLPGNIEGFFFIFAIEFLSMFFAKILLNKEKSKVPLLMLLGLFVVANLPFTKIYLSSSHINLSVDGSSNILLWIVVLLIITVIFYTLFNALYYLVQGFGQKRWEARTIVYVCSGATLLFIINIVLATNLTPGNGDQVERVIRYLANIAFCTYPLSAAIVLGRKNGHNQKQLLNLIHSIQKLSEENLQTEIEKKRILEGQKLELEKKVLERTKEVMLQKEEIEIKNKSITDNLNYAKRIQSAILPNTELIHKSFRESFIIYYPKDIVSGDFYAFAEKGKRTLIVAGDCTGHGVSGAFMSMIGVSLINRLILENNMVEPDVILNNLNSAVIETFRQSESDSNDGMDVAVCSFDLAANQLYFAGANRPLWLVRDHEITVIQPDKFPIGGLQVAANRQFNSSSISLQKNDAIYIFTDGYADQFGGEKGKKMMTAKLREKLLSIQGKSMKEQEQDLKAHFTAWKGNHEQVDDVLVIGIRI